MLAHDQYLLAIIAMVVIVVLEVWRRTLRHRAPRWVHVATVVLLVTIAGAVTYAQLTLHGVIVKLANEDASNKATMLARGIARAMNSNAIAATAAFVAFVVLGIGTWRARRIPVGGPVGTLRRGQ